MKKNQQQPTKDMEKLIALGKQKGFLTYDEVNDLLPEDLSSTVAIDHLFELLGNEDIQVVEGEADAGLSANRVAQQDKQNLVQQREELLTEQLKSEERFMPLDDPVKMYLKQMGSISLDDLLASRYWSPFLIQASTNTTCRGISLWVMVEIFRR